MRYRGTPLASLSVMRTLAWCGAFMVFAGVARASQGPDLPLQAPRRPLWDSISKDRVTAPAATRGIVPREYRTFVLKLGELTSLLARAPLEHTAAAGVPDAVMELPWPDGGFRRFRIEESPIMEPALAAQFPELKTYRGEGIDDPTATVRLDWTPFGFHAMVLGAEGTVFIDPYAPGDTQHYIAYFKRDYSRADADAFRCTVTGEPVTRAFAQDSAPALLQPAHGGTRRTYRLAVAATGEYTTFFGGVSGAMNGIVTTINRVNSIYERDLAVRLILVGNNSAIVFTNASTDPYTGGNGNAMQCENPHVLDANIGVLNYDIGHVFGAGNAGGTAQLGVVCSNANNCPAPSGSDKARGASAISSPRLDPFDVNYVAHEIGHQFSASHTFNGTTDPTACGAATGRVASTAFEPGSGSTILAYAGLCGVESLQPTADAYFHAGSQDQIIAFITNAATGGSCPVSTATGNTPPTVSAGPDYTIPAGTPFTLTAAGSDAGGNYLTYAWEEMDLGTQSPPNTDDGTRPIFRSFLPTASPSRTFPQLSDLLSNTTTLGESLPTTTRSMNFRVTVRDNRLSGGGTASDDMILNVRSDSGPFQVTQPNTAVTWAAGSTQTVTWNEALTSLAPVSCANVKISMSTDGGNTFSIVLAASTPNDGSETVAIPNFRRLRLGSRSRRLATCFSTSRMPALRSIRPLRFSRLAMSL
jgi:hypothetical protein